MRAIASQIAFATMLVAIADSPILPAAQAESDYPILPGTTPLGRTVWLGTCESCHAYGIAGSPDPSDPEAWRDRLNKPRAVLHEHAINGFFGPDDTYMPPRGGNAELSNEQVKAAVDYMAALANRTIQLAEENNDTGTKTNR